MSRQRAIFTAAMFFAAFGPGLWDRANAAPTGLTGLPSSVDGFLELFGDPLSDLAPIDAAVTALETRLRDYADLNSVLELAPTLVGRLPDNGRLRGVYAAALAASGDPRAARRQLDDFKRAPDGVWFNVALALNARNSGDLASAEAAIAAALQAEPDNAYALNISGTLSALRSDFDAAKTAFARATEIAPEAAAYHANLGAAQLRLGMPDLALVALDRAAVLDPASCTTRQMRATALSQQGRPGDAAEELEICLAKDPRNAELAGELLSALVNAGDLDAASAALETYRAAVSLPGLWQAEIALRQGDADGVRAALAAAPTLDPRAVAERRALASLIEGDAVTARDILADAMAGGGVIDPALRQTAFAVDAAQGSAITINLTPETPAEHFFAALFAARTDDATGTANHLEAAEGVISGFTGDGLKREFIPDAPALSKLAIGTALMLRGAADPAAEALTEAAVSGAPLALYVAGAHLRRANDLIAAVDLLERAVAAAPNFRAARLERSEAALATGDGATALDDLGAALRLRPTPAVALRLGVIAEALDNDKVARDAYENLLVLAPDNYIANNQLAWFLVSREGASKRAFDLATRANDLQPGNASTLDTLGWIHYLQGNTEQALEHLQQAFVISGGSIPIIRYHLAAAAFENDLPDRAREVLAPLSTGAVPENIEQDVAALRARLEASN